MWNSPNIRTAEQTFCCEADARNMSASRRMLSDLFADESLRRPDLVEEAEFSERDWGQHAIANLTANEIYWMPSESLVLIIDRWSIHLPQPDVTFRLPDLDRNTLEQLVYLVRQICR